MYFLYSIAHIFHGFYFMYKIKFLTAYSDYWQVVGNFSLIHFVYILLVLDLQLLPLQFECRSDQAHLWSPGCGYQCDPSWDLKLLQLVVLTMVSQGLGHSLLDSLVFTQIMEILFLVIVVWVQLGCKPLQLFLDGDDKSHCVSFVGVGVDTNIVHERMSLELGLHLAKTDILSCLELHQVLLPVNDLDVSILHQLSNVAGLEILFARLSEEIFSCLFFILKFKSCLLRTL